MKKLKNGGYGIARGLSPETLIEDVNNMIDDGWQPIGGVAVPLFDYGDAVQNGGDSGVYIQAMVK